MAKIEVKKIYFEIEDGKEAMPVFQLEDGSEVKTVLEPDGSSWTTYFKVVQDKKNK